jgi:acyl-CoA reductase-like NAD-dependent aldehyde dehydrogenase
MEDGQPGKNIIMYNQGKILNYIDGSFIDSNSQLFYKKLNPHNGEFLANVAEGLDVDVEKAVSTAEQSFQIWSKLTPVQRGEYLYEIVQEMIISSSELAEVISRDTGKSPKDALQETKGAIALGRFMAGEGQRFYGRTTTSGQPNKYPMIIREPVGVAALIISFNTPIANIAWKVFPALICGNTVVLKASEETPLTSDFFARLVQKANLPPGVFNVIYGTGSSVGSMLTKHHSVKLISFTGSTAVGKIISETVAHRLVKVFLELGGKNPLVVCDDADIDKAVEWSVLSAFSNAGQRCASASRIIVFDKVYDLFKAKFLKRTDELSLGIGNSDDLGPVINEKQMNRILSIINRGIADGATLLCGGKRSRKENLSNGWYIEPTLLEGASPDSFISQEEVFGPVTCLFRVNNLEQAIELANNAQYGLTASIHTTNIHRAQYFTRNVEAGVAIVNGGTFGSEPNMPFGGVKNSGNGHREPGTEALEIYSNYKNIITIVDPTKI